MLNGCLAASLQYSTSVLKPKPKLFGSSQLVRPLSRAGLNDLTVKSCENGPLARLKLLSCRLLQLLLSSSQSRVAVVMAY